MKIRREWLLLLASLIWGVAFVAQDAGMEYIGPYTFVCLRNILGTCTLLLVIPLLKQKDEQAKTYTRRDLITGGILCGIALFSASIFQQIGIQYTTVGKAGFITALYVILVPVLYIFGGNKVSLKIFLCVFVALAGFYFLCMDERMVLQKGDFYVLVSAVLFAFHILIIDHFSPRTDGVKLSCMQFFTAFVLGLLPMIFLEHPQVQDVVNAAVPLLYAGICSSGIAYTLQIVGQKGTDPTIATMLLSLESVFSVLAGMVLLHQMLSLREIFGCVLIFAAVIAAQYEKKE
ncbi:MAG: DMT family transporter [Solobacterium sp.]|nr:DMT family transporter [Solobacterium sp.]